MVWPIEFDLAAVKELDKPGARRVVIIVVRVGLQREVYRK